MKKTQVVPTFKDGTPDVGLAGLARLLTKKAEESDAYAAGYDAGLNGPNETNCCFSIFSTPANTKEWERGKAAGDRAKAAKS